MLNPEDWQVRRIVIVGPGIVGMPMAAMLAHARIRIGTDEPARVVIIQRKSRTSGWKVDAINKGRSVIGGIEPDLDRLVAESVSEGLLRASHDYGEARDADVILICVQTDKKGYQPDYGPMFEALNGVARVLKNKPAEKIPLIVFESTLAPSTMATLIKDYFAKYGLVEGIDILLGNSPNRVMAGRLLERVASSDKLVGGLNPVTPMLIQRLYKNIVTVGTLHSTNSLTAEVVKTLENAYRDVRIAYSAEIARYCDKDDIDFYGVRSEVNKRLGQTDGACEDPNAVASGGVLIPTLGVGGHCLPKDGILLWWRMIEAGRPTSRSLILESRAINDESPAETVRLAERSIGDISGKAVAVMGAAYRFNSNDTRNSPSLVLVKLLLERGCKVRIHDPYVKASDQNLIRSGFQSILHQHFEEVVAWAEYLFFCTAHRLYMDRRDEIIGMGQIKGVVDGCNLYSRSDFDGRGVSYTGIGRGTRFPSPEFVDFVHQGFKVIERGIANEVLSLVEFLNENYASDAFNEIEFEQIQQLAGTCPTGCRIVDAAPVDALPSYHGFASRLVQCAYNAHQRRKKGDSPGDSELATFRSKPKQMLA